MIQAPELTWVTMSGDFCASDAQVDRLRQFFSKSHGRSRVYGRSSE
jgi:hypothetical protein